MILCVGDIHLGRLDTYVKDAYLKVLATLVGALDMALDRGATDVVLLGDVSDTVDLPDNMLVEMLSIFLKYKELTFHVIPGNHDYQAEGKHSLLVFKWLSDHGVLNIRLYSEPEIVVIDENKYFMCPHPYVVDMPKGCSYAFGHFGFDGAKADNGRVLTTKNAPKGRWILGDYHTPQRGKSYIYPGSLCQTKFGESTDKGVVLLDEDGPFFVKWKPEILLKSATIKEAADLEQITEDAYWSISLTKDSILPDNWASRYKNIIRISNEKPLTKRARALLKATTEYDILSGLDTFLMSKGNLSDKEIRLARQLLGV